MCTLSYILAAGYQDLVKEYEQRGVPLDVMVLDIDWHITFYKEAAEGKKDQVKDILQRIYVKFCSGL